MHGESLARCVASLARPLIVQKRHERVTLLRTMDEIKADEIKVDEIRCHKSYRQHKPPVLNKGSDLGFTKSGDAKVRIVRRSAKWNI